MKGFLLGAIAGGAGVAIVAVLLMSGSIGQNVKVPSSEQKPSSAPSVGQPTVPTETSHIANTTTTQHTIDVNQILSNYDSAVKSFALEHKEPSFNPFDKDTGVDLFLYKDDGCHLFDAANTRGFVGVSGYFPNGNIIEDTKDKWLTGDATIGKENYPYVCTAEDVARSGTVEQVYKDAQTWDTFSGYMKQHHAEYGILKGHEELLNKPQQ